MNRYAVKKILIWLAIGIPVILVMNWVHSNYVSKRDKNARYTIGTTKGVHSEYNNGFCLHYTFTVNGVKHEEKNGYGDKDVERHVITNNGRYYVKFCVDDPTNSTLMTNIPVPDSIEDFPDSGWVLLPGTIYSLGYFDHDYGDHIVGVRVLYNHNASYEELEYDSLKKEDIGKMFLVSFFPCNSYPYINELKAYKPRPDSLKIYAPDTGWVKRPF